MLTARQSYSRIKTLMVRSVALAMRLRTIASHRLENREGATNPIAEILSSDFLNDPSCAAGSACSDGVLRRMTLQGFLHLDLRNTRTDYSGGIASR